MNRTHAGPDVDVQVQRRGEVPAEAADYARAKVGSVVARLREPILAVRVKLTRDPHPSVARPARAEATVDVNGRPVRAHVAAATVMEAVDLLKDRLAGRLNRLAHRREENRHPHQPAPRPEPHPHPPQEREIVRRKSFVLRPQSVDEAVAELEALDHDFYLFTDAATTADSVVYRSPSGYRVARTGTAAAAAATTTAPVTESPTPAARLTVRQAVQRLESAALPFVFFTDTVTDRGAILYRRHDGDYGLISPGT